MLYCNIDHTTPFHVEKSGRFLSAFFNKFGDGSQLRLYSDSWYQKEGSWKKNAALMRSASNSDCNSVRAKGMHLLSIRRTPGVRREQMRAWQVTNEQGILQRLPASYPLFFSSRIFCCLGAFLRISDTRILRNFKFAKSNKDADISCYVRSRTELIDLLVYFAYGKCSLLESFERYMHALALNLPKGWIRRTHRSHLLSDRFCRGFGKKN